MMRRLFLSLAMAAIPALAACAPNMARVDADSLIAWSDGPRKVLLVDPDIELYELTVTDSAAPRADWTRTASDYIKADVAAALSARGIATVTTGRIGDPHEAQLVRLHNAVGSAMLLHLYVSALQLPSKHEAVDWTLGTGVETFRKHYGGDYALFVHLRDSYSSDGHKALMAGAALLLVPIPGGMQRGFASLVDLRTGHVVWFNVLANMDGDLRSEKPAADTVAALLKGLPL